MPTVEAEIKLGLVTVTLVLPLMTGALAVSVFPLPTVAMSSLLIVLEPIALAVDSTVTLPMTFVLAPVESSPPPVSNSTAPVLPVSV
jgi:hypothetical protein